MCRLSAKEAAAKSWQQAVYPVMGGPEPWVSFDDDDDENQPPAPALDAAQGTAAQSSHQILVAPPPAPSPGSNYLERLGASLSLAALSPETSITWTSASQSNVCGACSSQRVLLVGANFQACGSWGSL
eukprot:COSAG05_NODE_1935_length_3814_cov_2.663795_4_plen_128_part_00